MYVYMYVCMYVCMYIVVYTCGIFWVFASLDPKYTTSVRTCKQPLVATLVTTPFSKVLSSLSFRRRLFGHGAPPLYL